MKIFSVTSIRQINVSIPIILVFGLISMQSHAQQNPYPFTVDLNFGGGLIGDSNANTAFQPEFGFSYMPGKFGIGLNAGLLSYNPSFDAQQYRSGFEDYTSVSGSGKKWSSFFIGIGPRFEFGSRLPVTFRSSLDLSLSYNSPPSVSVDFYNPDGSAAGIDLQLSGYEAGEDYSKWSAALRPEFQMQFSPGGSDRFAIQVTTGIQHRLSKNEFTYTQKDLSEVRLVPNSEEMYAQFDGAPTVQQSSHPPQTNFFTSVGFKIKFGKPKADAKRTLEGFSDFDLANNDQNGDCDDGDERCTPAGRAQDYNAARSNKPTSRAEDIGDGDLDSDDDGIGDAIETSQDYNSSRSNKPRTEDNRGGKDEIMRQANRMARLVNPTGAIVSAGAVAKGINPLYEGSTSEGENPLYEGQANDGDADQDNNNDSRDPVPVQKHELQPSSFCMELSTMKVSTNSQKGMRAGDQGSGSSRIAAATDYNSSRSNTTSSVDLGGDGNGNHGSDSTRIAAATDYNSSRSNTTSSVDLGGDGNGNHGSDSTRIAAATDYNSSRSNTTSSVDLGDLGSDGFPDLMKNASLKVNRKIKPGKIKTGDVTLKTDTGDGDMDSDGYGDAAGFQFDLEIDPIDPDDDGDGLMDALESATYSISKRSARTGRNSASVKKEIETMESKHGVARNQTSDIYKWTYNLSDALSNTGDLNSDHLPDLMKNATLTLLFTEGKMHVDLQIDPIDPDDDGDGYGDLLQNGSFSISKRSARTGRN